MPVAGRYQRGVTRDLLSDSSATIEIAPRDSSPAHGDQIRALLHSADGRLELTDIEVLAPARRAPTPELLALAARRPALSARAAVIAAIRNFFSEQDFLEVETPTRVVNPGLEPHLRPFAAGRDADGHDRYLITSPELHLKRMLAAGYERVFELARAFRDDEHGALHRSEFLLLEWYRSHCGLDALADDLSRMLRRCHEAVHRLDGTSGDDRMTRPMARATYGSLFREHVGSDPATLSVDDREIAWVTEVEPHLGSDAPLLVTEFPADAAALARLTLPTDATGYALVAARMELYIGGVELANGFDELNDPDEQRRRHEHDRVAREAVGTDVPPLDEGFLDALESAMPPAAGMALGVDRLVMLLTGAPDIGAVRAFS